MTAIPAVRQHTIWRQIWRYRTAYLFIAPFYISFAAFSLYPMIYTILLSFHEWDGGRAPWHPVGLTNYINLFFHDRVFHMSLVNSLIYWSVLVPLLVGASIACAAILNLDWLRGRTVFRTVLFLPYITSTLIMSLVFLSLLDDNYGWLNAGLRALGLPAIPWLRSTEYSKFSVILLIFWRNIGYYTIIMLAGLQSIERELYEAAAIDGATGWQAFRWITIPLMRPVILFVTIVTTIMVLNMFEAVYALTRGGPEYSSQPLMLMLYQVAFQFARLGVGSALAMLIGFLTILIALVQLKVIRGIE
jgi:lactose/L-arabinose transport system permease protein